MNNATRLFGYILVGIAAVLFFLISGCGDGSDYYADPSATPIVEATPTLPPSPGSGHPCTRPHDSGHHAGTPPGRACR
jgi:hypothetical protein